MPRPNAHAPRVDRASLRRLAHFEYDNTIADLLGLKAGASERFAADTVVNGFDNNAEALVVTPLLGDQLYASAERLAGEAVKNPAGSCRAPRPSGDMACAERFDRALRPARVPPAAHRRRAARYLSCTRSAPRSGGFDAGLELVLTALLQSPNFLYRTELGEPSSGGSYALDAYELATELAYTLTGVDARRRRCSTRPSAANSRPTRRSQAQAERLIDGPRGREQLVRFVREWLDVGRLALGAQGRGAVSRVRRRRSAARWRVELERFVTRRRVRQRRRAGTLHALLDAPLAFVNDELAQFYGLPLPASSTPQGFGARDDARTRSAAACSRSAP